ncbi:transposase [Rhodohalobacter sp. 8-1]|uniref:transposase n=1 Tax=Rhodohalobacter sp. 8-1 TaxID=3131972 RepID=UPI0030EED709
MTNTYSQLYAKLIFAVKGRSSFIQNKWSTELYKYIAGIVHEKSQTLYSIGGMADHVHLLSGNQVGMESDKIGYSYISQRKLLKDGFISGSKLDGWGNHRNCCC